MKKIIPPEKLVGPFALKLGKSHNISVRRLAKEITFSMANDDGRWKKDGIMYEEDTIYGYLHGNSWPKMPIDTTIEIIQKAFENVVPGQEKESINHDIAAGIKEIYTAYQNEIEKDIVAGAAAEYLLRIHCQELAHFIEKHIEACSSLNTDETDLWISISEWPQEQTVDFFEKWKAFSGTTPFEVAKLFDCMTSQAFIQLVTIRDKNFSQMSTATRSIEGLKKKIYKMTTTQNNSLIAVMRHAEYSGTQKHPLGTPEEIDLLILFKYFLTDAQRAAMLEEVKNRQQKPAERI